MKTPRWLSGLVLLTLAMPSLARASVCCGARERQAQAAVLESACCCPTSVCEAALVNRAQPRAVLMMRSDDGAASLSVVAVTPLVVAPSLTGRVWSLHAPPLSPFLTHHTFLIPLRP